MDCVEEIDSNIGLKKASLELDSWGGLPLRRVASFGLVFVRNRFLTYLVIVCTSLIRLLLATLNVSIRVHFSRTGRQIFSSEG